MKEIFGAVVARLVLCCSKQIGVVVSLEFPRVQVQAMRTPTYPGGFGFTSIHIDS